MTTEPKPQALKKSLRRYQVLSLVTGTFLILVFVGVFIKYVIQPESDELLAFIRYVQMFHGFIYIVYLWFAIDLWTRVKWGLGRLALLALAGVIPVVAFFAERRVTRDVAATLDA